MEKNLGLYQQLQQCKTMKEIANCCTPMTYMIG